MNRREGLDATPGRGDGAALGEGRAMPIIATRIEIRTAALRGGELVATLYLVEPGAAEEVAERLRINPFPFDLWIVEVGPRGPVPG